MARIEDTAGNKTYTIPNCDCGLTGGCEMCQPIYIPYKPSPRFDPEVFYEPTHEQRKQRLREIREKSHRDLGEAWRYLANH